ncbi:MAG TPA: hypothetical protein HPP94_08660 [Desulfuromonadales bacterium]|nr:hypothetical protein [Desulfuromonadales bacterium]
MVRSYQIMAAKEGDATGFKWDVRVAAFGQDLNGNYWDKEVMSAAVGKFEGAKVFMLTEAQHQNKPHRFGKPTGEMVGVLQGAIAKQDGIYATLILLPTSTWLRDNLVGCAEMGLENVLGLSVDVSGKMGLKLEAGRKLPMMTSINSVTVDVVYDPVAKGEFLKMAAARQTDLEEETPMIKTLMAAFRLRHQADADRIQAALDGKTMTESQAIEQMMAAMDKGTNAAGADQIQAASALLQETRLLASSMLLDKQLSASKLPEPVQEKLRASFGGTVITEDALQAAIKLEKETLDKLTASGQVRGVGDVRVGRETGDKLQAAVDGLFQVPVADAMRDVPVFNSIRAAYTEITGDSDVRGYQDNASRMQAAFDTSTFSYLLGNALYRRMVADYRETTDFGLSRLISNVRNARDFRPLQAIRIAYFGDLPDVNPENIDYADLGTLTDEKMEYALNQKGGIITITRKMIINDDMTAINRIVSRLPRAARRTKAKRAWNKFINNDIYKGDSLATFHASHNNLSTTAYALASAVAGRTAIAKQTEPGSGERLALRPVTLAIPSDLWDAAVQLNQTRGVPGSANQGNSMFNYFGANNEGIIECPFMTDATDWMMFADPKDVEILEVAYLNGQQEPEMFVADQPTVGQFFVADKLQYKIRDEYEFEIMDYRGAYKAVVAG